MKRLSALLSAVAVLAVNASAQTPRPARPASAIHIGDLVGTEYSPRTNEFVLYATEPSRTTDTLLYVDDVIKIAQAVLSAGDFAFSLEQEKREMQIRYLPPEAEATVRPIFRWSTVEETLLKTDRVLKDLAHGRKVADGLALGLSEFLICAQDVEAWVASGKSVESYPMDPYVTYFELAARYNFEGFEGVGVWFEEPQILVKAASRKEGADPPECVRRFSEDLTANMYQLLAHYKLGQEFRRLRMLLLLCKTFGWARSIFVPIDQQWLKSLPTREVRNEPVRVRELPLTIIGRNKKVAALIVRGGILFSVMPGSVFPAEPAGALTQARVRSNIRMEQSAGPAPGFDVAPTTLGGRRLLKIDITALLGLKRRV